MGLTRAVLVVDDEPGVRSRLGSILEALSIGYDEAEDGAAAIGAIRRRPYGAVILDLSMPGIDGIGVMNTLRAANPAMLSRVILLAEEDPDLDANVIERIFKVLTKPFVPLEVAVAVQDCLLQPSLIGSDVMEASWGRGRLLSPLAAALR